MNWIIKFIGGLFLPVFSLSPPPSPPFLSSSYFHCMNPGPPMQQTKHCMKPGKNGNQGLLILPGGRNSPGHVRGLWKAQ